MREPQTTAAGIGENKWRDDDPKPKHQFKRFFPPAESDEFQLGDQEYCEPAECGIQHGRDIGAPRTIAHPSSAAATNQIQSWLG